MALCHDSGRNPKCGPRASVRTLLADKEPFFLAGLRASLEAIPMLRILGESEAGRQLVEAQLQHKPDLLITGFLFACGRDALGLASDIHAAYSPTRIVVLLDPAAAGIAPRLFSAGIHGVVSRRANHATLHQAIHSVIEGGSYVDPDFLGSQSCPDPPDGLVQTNMLTAREREVFRMIGERKSAGEIAATLGVSAKTISTHRENIKAKLHLLSAKSLEVAANAHVLWESCGSNFSI